MSALPGTIEQAAHNQVMIYSSGDRGPGTAPLDVVAATSAGPDLNHCADIPVLVTAQKQAGARVGSARAAEVAIERHAKNTGARMIQVVTTRKKGEVHSIVKGYAGAEYTGSFEGPPVRFVPHIDGCGYRLAGCG